MQGDRPLLGTRRGKVAKDLFLNIYLSMPFFDEGRSRRKELNKILYAEAMAEEAAAAAAPAQEPAPAAQMTEAAYTESAAEQLAEPAVQQEAAPAQAEAAPAPAPAPRAGGFGGFGRKLRDDEW